MFYIKIPQNMHYERVLLDDITAHDYFVSDTNPEEKKSIQEAVKLFCEGRKNEDSINGMTLYKKKPLISSYIEYRAQNNGTRCSEHVRIVSIAAHPSTHHFSAEIRKPLRWFSNTPLSDERKSVVDQKSAEQRDNRRHVGDSPNPT